MVLAYVMEIQMGIEQWVRAVLDIKKMVECIS